MAAGGLLGVEALGGVLRADVAFQLDVEERIALLEQRDVIDAEIAAHGVDEDELAFLAGAVFDALLALGGRQLGEFGVDLLDRGLGARARHRPDGENRQTDNRQTLHVRYLLLRAGFNRPGGIYAAKSSGRENVLQETRRFR